MYEYIGLHVKSPAIFGRFQCNLDFWTEFHEHPSAVSRSVPCGGVHGQTDRDRQTDIQDEAASRS